MAGTYSVLEQKPVTYGTIPGVCTALCRLLCCKGKKMRGEFEQMDFPISVSEFEKPEAVAFLTEALTKTGYLTGGAKVKSVSKKPDITAGLLAMKCIIALEYEGGGPNLPKEIFVKCNLAEPFIRRLACDMLFCSGRNEATFYKKVQPSLVQKTGVLTPSVYFVERNTTTSEYVLMLEVIKYGEGDILPFKHRITHDATDEERKAMLVACAKVNAAYWGGVFPELDGVLQFVSKPWPLFTTIIADPVQMIMKKELNGCSNPKIMQWTFPPGFSEIAAEVASTIPKLMEDLDADTSMRTFGYGDMVLDNCFFKKSPSGLQVGFFDWQTATVYNVGVEWAWNMMHQPTESLRKNEAGDIDLLMSTWKANGVKNPPSREKFMQHYTLGLAFGFALMATGAPDFVDIFGKDVFSTLDPSAIPAALQDNWVGYRVISRYLENTAEAMGRLNFVEVWKKWKQEGLKP